MYNYKIIHFYHPIYSFLISKNSRIKLIFWAFFFLILRMSKYTPKRGGFNNKMNISSFRGENRESAFTYLNKDGVKKPLNPWVATKPVEKSEPEKVVEIKEDVEEVDDLADEIRIILSMDDVVEEKPKEEKKEKVENKFAYTKFCNDMANKGTCANSHCTYAHSMSQYKPPVCSWGIRCNNIRNPFKTCQFLHPGEDVNQYIARIKLVVPQNILTNQHNERVGILMNKERDLNKKRDQKLEEVKEMVKLEKVDYLPSYPEIVLKTNLGHLQTEMTKLTKLGYKNINVVLDGNDTRIFNTIPWVYFNFLNDLFAKFNYDNICKFDNDDRYKLTFNCSEGGFVFRNIILKSKDDQVVKIDKHLSGYTSGWDLIDNINKEVDNLGATYRVSSLRIVMDGDITTFDLEVV